MNSNTAGKNIIITGAFRFPDKDAASQRVLGLGKALKAGGNNVKFAGWENEPREFDFEADKQIYTYQDFPYFSQAELDLSHSNILNKVASFIFRGAKTIRWFKKYIKSNPVDVVVIYNANVYFILRMLVLCKANNIKLVCDCTEWYEADHLPGGRFGLANADNNFRIKVVYPMVKNVILISSYLKGYLEGKKSNIIVVPPLIVEKSGHG